jgi:hypothetical protein
VPLLVYSVLRLALFGACWVALLWAGFVNPWVAAVVAALAAWGLSYVALPGPRDAAARWLAEQDARRKEGVPQLSARAQQDAADEDALIGEQDETAPGDVAPGGAQDEGVPDEPRREGAATGLSPDSASPDEPSSDNDRAGEPLPDEARPDADRRA